MNDKTIDAETLLVMRHDIKNHLSNIHLALETLRYEIANPTEDFTFCIDIISTSAAKINELLKQTE
ncbi:MAG: hypothetical protein JWQ79_3266 [Mucilaginibacter sp.]|jgi:hypothetical protein|nr:hypothetical protein [Mucilaginibacter sp.]